MLGAERRHLLRSSTFYGLNVIRHTVQFKPNVQLASKFWAQAFRQIFSGASEVKLTRMRKTIARTLKARSPARLRRPVITTIPRQVMMKFLETFGDFCQNSEGGMIRLETLIELIFVDSIFSSLSSFWNLTNAFLSNNSRQQYLSQHYPLPLLRTEATSRRLSWEAMSCCFPPASCRLIAIIINSY